MNDLSVIVFTMKGCPFCEQFKEMLVKENIEFFDRDIDKYKNELNGRAPVERKVTAKIDRDPGRHGQRADHHDDKGAQSRHTNGPGGVSRFLGSAGRGRYQLCQGGSAFVVTGITCLSFDGRDPARGRSGALIRF